jgi:pimeloyl-ACP methyl ester carboxylesterase
VTLHHVDPGDAPPAVLLHGFWESWLDGRLPGAPLAAPGLRVVARDMPGHNLSPRPGRGRSDTVDRLASLGGED